MVTMRDCPMAVENIILNIYFVGCEEDIRGVIRMAVKSFFKEKKKRKGSSRRGRISPCSRGGKY